MTDLADTVALISGGARGMGAACARRLVADGARVVVGDLLLDEARALADELGEPCSAVALDVTSPESWSAAVAAAPGLNALINNAGVLRRTKIEAGDLDVFAQVIAVNQTGVYLGMRACAAALRDAGGGAIVNISSIDGMLGMRDMSAYVASKWAVRGMTKVAALELAPHGIRCNSVHPGYIDTPMLTVGGRMPDEVKRSLAGQVPLGALGTPADVAATCAFLISADARYVNGAELVVDGGLIAGLEPGS